MHVPTAKNLFVTSSPRLAWPLTHQCIAVAIVSISCTPLCASYVATCLLWMMPGEINICWIYIKFNVSFNNQNNIMRLKLLFSCWEREVYWSHAVKKKKIRKLEFKHLLDPKTVLFPWMTLPEGYHRWNVFALRFYYIWRGSLCSNCQGFPRSRAWGKDESTCGLLGGDLRKVRKREEAGQRREDKKMFY